MGERGTNVLEQYDFLVTKTVRGRGVQLCETDAGLMLLREYTGSLHRLSAEQEILELLKSEGISVDSYVKNREGQVLSIDTDGTKYTLKKWFRGRECDVKNPSEILEAVRALGILHVAFRRISDEISKENRETMQRLAAPTLFVTFEKHQREMKKIRAYIRSKQKKTEFELQILENFEGFYREGEMSLSALKNSAYLRLKKEADDEGRLCHGNYNYHNILIDDRQTAVVNFEKMSVDVQLVDLYLFMRKILEKYNWDVELGEKMLETYQKVIKLSKEEKEVLMHLFSYPEKFWKLVNHYYNNNKAWLSQKDVEKLNAVVRQNTMKRKALDKILNSY